MNKKAVANVLSLALIASVAGTGTLGFASEGASTSGNNVSANDVSGNDASDNESEYALGDVNLDGNIDYSDAIMVLRYDSMIASFTDEQVALGDVNGDGETTYLDAILILRYDANLIDSFDADTEEETVLMTKVGNTSSAEVYSIDLSGLTEEQIDSIASIEAGVMVDSGFVNGCIGGNVDGNWASGMFEIYTANETDVAYYTWDIDGSLLAYDDDGNLSPLAQVQFWWVNPIYDDDGNEIGEGTATLTSVIFYDADGNVINPADGDDETDTDTEVVEYETAVEAMGVSYGTSAVVDSSDYSDKYYSSAVIHIDALNYNDSTVDAYWNDWCMLAVAVTVEGETTYYAVNGSQVSWDVTVDDMGTDDADDDIKILTTDDNFLVLDTTDGTDITVDITGDEWSIEVIALGWDSAADTAYAEASFTLIGYAEVSEDVAIIG